MLLPLVILLLLSMRELLIAIRIPRGHLERNMAVFNCIILLLFFLAGVYGVRLFVMRDAAFAAVFPRYPNARYAPEREIFREGGERIYVTGNSPAEVVRYYDTQATSSGYHVTLDDNAEVTGRLIVERGEKRMFLTVQKEGNTTVLYFSGEGEMKTVTRSTH